MSLDGDYDDTNVFALMVAGKIPYARIFEDERTLAFLDIQPQSRGHSLVISKWSRARNILEIEHEALREVMGTVQRVATALRATLAPDGLQIAQFNGGDAGQTIFHLHVHVIPRWQGDPIGLHRPATSKAGDPAELAALAERIAANIPR